MKPTPQTCTLARELWLEDRGRAKLHAADCPACGEWLARQGLVTGVLGSMDRVVAPLELEERVVEDLASGSGALLGALRGLERLEAPARLEERLASELAQEEPELAADVELETPAWAPLLEGLAPLTAPSVLDRLVDEELADTPKALTRRLVGGLFRKDSPRVLTVRVADSLESDSEGALEAPKRTLLRSRWLPLGSAAAAALLIWSASPFLLKDAKEPTRHFRVVRVESLASMDPLAKSLVEGLAGGRVQAMDQRRITAGGEL